MSVSAKLGACRFGQNSVAMELAAVTCPSCFEVFEVAVPPPSELPADLDYDCEICCRPMSISVSVEDGEVFAEARGLED